MTDFAFVLRVLDTVAKFEQHYDLYWRTDGEFAPIQFFVNCNDTFWWASADSEQVTPENIGDLERAYADAKAAAHCGECYGSMLFCARIRKMRPQGAAYPDDEKLWPLLDACGPERPIGVGNPRRPGKRTI
jgi:hypothetical protein